MAGTKLLTDKPYRDGSPTRRNRPKVVNKAIDPATVPMVEKQKTSELRKSSSSKKSGGTPMKMLIAQEMSKEVESKRKSPNIVARLMGLEEVLPAQQSVLTAKVPLQEHGLSSRVALSGVLNECRRQDDGYFDRSLPCELRSCAQEKEYRDVYEVWQQPARLSGIKGQPLHKGRFNDTQNERRMALVRQKFVEAKRLATDEKLLQSKEFQDALEVLSSNRDLFLKFLEEPNSLFSKHLRELQSIPPPPQTKRITILKPSKTVETQQYPETDEGEWDMKKPQWNSDTAHPKAGILSQPTRIVVLKPSPGKNQDMKPMASPHISSPNVMEKSDSYRAPETEEAIDSRDVAKEITRHMRESFSSNRRDESLLFSALSNGYVGDDSSFNRSDNEYMEEEDCNLSDSEVVTPTSRHSWDYTNRFGSPYSFSSVSRASYSPESSVIREAKKRLSERWALVASNGINHQAKVQVRRSSSTLGEMLAIPEVKKDEVNNEELSVSSSRSYGRDEDPRVPTACLSTGRTKDGEGGEKSPWNLSRSKSVPVSSSSYENIGLHAEAPDSQTKGPNVPKELAKSKSAKSSFKGKVSSLFFSRNKKAGREKSISSPSVGSNDEIAAGISQPIVEKNDDSSKLVRDDHSGDSPLANSEEDSIAASAQASVMDGPKRGKINQKEAISLEKLMTSESLSQNEEKLNTSEKPSENQDQPSPTSILDAPFEDDTNNSTPDSSEISLVVHPQALSRSQPIESVARSLSWDDTQPATSLHDSLKRSRALHKRDEEEQDRFLFVQNLLSAAELNNEKSNVVFVNWHSVESPLDPILLDKLLDRKEEEAKSRERRSNQRLLFDCVNIALLDIGRTAILSAYPWAKAGSMVQKVTSTGAPMAAQVWLLVRDWFSGDRKGMPVDADNGGLVVDRFLRSDVAGSGWAELMQSEIDEISKEIGGEVLEELVGEVLVDLTSGCV